MTKNQKSNFDLNQSRLADICCNVAQALDPRLPTTSAAFCTDYLEKTFDQAISCPTPTSRPAKR
jgi:hypothetical protein